MVAGAFLPPPAPAQAARLGGGVLRAAARRVRRRPGGRGAPADHMSTPYVYRVEPSRISGARYLRRAHRRYRAREGIGKG